MRTQADLGNPAEIEATIVEATALLGRDPAVEQTVRQWLRTRADEDSDPCDPETGDFGAMPLREIAERWFEATWVPNTEAMLAETTE